MIMRERTKALTQSYSPERILDKKLEAYRFIDLLGIRRPQLISGKATHDTLPAVLDHCVIKPVNGKSSYGVYAVFNENVIQKIKTAEVFSGRETLVERLKEDLRSGTAKEDRWIIEELIVEDDNPASGFVHGVSTPRFSNGYFPLRNRLGILVETHSWRT